MNISVILFLFVFLSWCFQFHWTRRRLYRLSWNVPGPLNLPFIGAAYITLQGSVAETGRKILSVLACYPNLCKFWVGPHLVYMTTRAEHAKIILNAPGATEKIVVMKYLAEVLGNGLVTLPADHWRRHRKIITPSFNQNILNTYPTTISQHCLIMIEKLGKCVGMGEVDPCKFITNCILDVVGETMCGYPFDSQKTDEKCSEMVERSSEIIFLRIAKIIYQLDWIFTRSNDYKELKDLENKLRNISRPWIARSRSVDDKPFISLMRAKLSTNELTEKEIEDEINTFLVAGTDTNAVSMCWLLTLLAIHQDVQQKVYEEVIDVVGTDSTIDLESFNKLDYTKRVVKESLRLLPTIPFIGRFLEEDIVLDGTIVPKGANIGISMYDIHRSEDYWTEPLKFDPDRFLPENSANRHPYAWIPFSGGPRNCIGFKYALMTMRIMTAMIIRKFKVTTSIKSIDEIVFNITIVAKPIDGFKMAFERR